jgi:hypothetical protein
MRRRAMLFGAAALVACNDEMLVQYSSPMVQFPGGYTVFAPFTVSGLAANGQQLIVTRTSGTFAAKSFGSGSPQLFDTIDYQYSNGVDLGLYSGFADGTDIGTTLYARQSKSFAAGTDIMRYYTSRSKRTSFDTAVYATLGMTLGKGCLGTALWPAAYGTRNNQTLYISYIGKSRLPYTNDGSGGAGEASNKTFRIINSSYSQTAGSDAIGRLGNGFNGQIDRASLSSSFVTNITGPGFADQWVRYECHADVTNGIVEIWANQQFVIQRYSGYGGEWECCHSSDVLYANQALTDTFFNPSKYGVTFDLIDFGLFGFDDGHNLSDGDDYDLAQIYQDPNIERFEISDAATWDVGPTSTMNRELCGRWSRDSSTQCTVYISQGQFASLSGKYLWYVNGRNTAEKVALFN